MNNVELQEKIEVLLNNDNILDMFEEIIDFEKDYKNSDFYKKTKMPLLTLCKEVKTFYFFNIKYIMKKLQEGINKLDLSHLEEILNQVAEVFGQENQDITEMLKEAKEITF